MMMMRGDFAAWNALGPAEKQAVMEKYFAYVSRLKAAGAFVEGAALTDNARRLVPDAERGARATDGPYVDAKESLQGYFIVEAPSLDSAVALAHDCPCFRHGETMDVIQISEGP
jgi:hypothetical protein